MTMSIVTLETPRLILKQITLEDAPSYQKHFNDYEIIRYLSRSFPWPFPEDGAVKFIENVILAPQNEEIWFWGIFLKSNPQELIGCIALWRKGKPEHRGFWLGRSLWGQGLMTEAAERVTEYAFTEIGFEKLVFSNALGHIQSRRIKEKAGARLISVEPADFVDPNFNQQEVWELTKAEWIASKR